MCVSYVHGAEDDLARGTEAVQHGGDAERADAVEAWRKMNVEDQNQAIERWGMLVNQISRKASHALARGSITITYRR